MGDVRTQARLVDFSPSPFAAGGLSTTIPRAEIAEAATQGDYPARLDLHVDRVEAAREEGASEPARVAIEWDETTLEQLLQSTDDEEVVLWFDPAEIARAIEGAEVDAHGLRERVAAVAVAVAATGATAGAGLAAPIAPGGQAAIPDLPAGMTLSDPGRALTSESAVSADAFGPQTIAPAGRAVIPDLSAGQTLSPPGSGGERETASSPAGAAGSAADSTTPPSTAGRAVIPDLPAGQTLTPAGSVGRDSAGARPESAVSAAADSSTQLPTAGRAAIPDLPAGMTLEPPATASAQSSGEAISFPSTAETAGIAAGVTLLITAAGFGVVRSRTRPSRPA